MGKALGPGSESGAESPWDRPVGIFDSGVGGLSVWREIRRQLPWESLIYFGDQAHLPYGPLPPAAVRGHAEDITGFLLARGCKAIVAACNTASAAALQHLRTTFPQVPFIGMEPAVKPAAQRTRSRIVGVMATPGTLEGEMFADAVARFAIGITLIKQPCPGLVERIEAGELETPATEALLRELMKPILGGGADTLVLACTHFPFLQPQIERLAGPGLEVIDPAPAVARQLERVLEERGLNALEGTRTQHRFFTSATAGPLREALRYLLQLEAKVEAVKLTPGRMAKVAP